MNPIQPFFALSTDHYYKKIINRYGISHIYGFHCQEPLTNLPDVLPDGCIDIVFDLSEEEPTARVCGSVSASETSTLVCQSGHDYLGIRFQPGYVPSFLRGNLSDFVDHEVSLKNCLSDAALLEKIHAAATPRCQENLIIQACMQTDGELSSTASGVSDAQRVLLRSLLHMITDTNGQMRVQDMEAETGYSRRYMNEVFHSYMGFSLKKMSEIIRFQSALAELTHNNDISITDLALKYGYYDQPQFNREFRRVLHTTPKKYRGRLTDTHYLEHFCAMHLCLAKNTPAGSLSACPGCQCPGKD